MTDLTGEQETSVRLWKDQPLYRRTVDGYFDATQMCNTHGKRFNEYERSKRGIDYIVELEKVISSGDGKETCIIDVQRGGSQGGSTWIHPRLAVDLARWLSAAFAVWIDGWVLETLATINKANTQNFPSRVARTFLHQKQIINETDLHYAVVAWLRRFVPDVILVAGLGELQDAEPKRLDAWSKGYTAGQPDLMLLNRHQHFSGFALELKHPGHEELRVSNKQKTFLSRLQAENWKILASNDYDEICFEISCYMRDVCPKCSCCQVTFCNKRAMDIHMRNGVEPPKKKQRRIKPPDLM